MSVVVSCAPADDTPVQDTALPAVTTNAGSESSVTTQAPVETQPIIDGFEIDVSLCAIVRPATPTSALLTSIVELKTAIDKATGSVVNLISDKKAGDEAALEIIVGDTALDQTQASKQKLDKDAYIIERVGNKIVIVGMTDAITIQAISFFIDTYLSSASGGKIVVPNDLCVISESFEFIDIIKHGRCQYSVVYSDELDTSPNSNNNKIDYQVQMAKDVRQKIFDLTGIGVSVKNDYVKPGANVSATYEILVGHTGREESQKVLESYDVNEYGVTVVGNKIVVTGWTDTTIGLAAKMFMEIASGAIVTEADGTKNIKLLSGMSRTKRIEEWNINIPKFEDGTLSGCSTCNHDDILYYYTDVTESSFTEYCTKLEGEGYKLYSINSMAGNRFATYVSSDSNYMVHVYYTKYDSSIRIVTGSVSDDTVLPYNVDGPEKYTKVTESKVTQMTLDYASGNFGMCYIVTLEDGSFIIFDGGGRAGGIDHIRLYNLLVKLNERPDGKIVIAAWILTHSHQDHYVVFSNFCNKYGSEVTIEQHISNVPDTIVRYNSGNPGGHMEDGTYDAAKTAVGGFKQVKPYTGMKFWVRNAEIDILYTHEALYPEVLRIFNNSTMVMKMTIGGQEIMWLGDIQNEGSNVICDMYGNTLKSDIVQVSHHGGTGATKEFYALIDPAVAFWPTSASNYKKQTAGTSTTGANVVDYYLAKQLNVVDIFVAQPDNISITLPFKPGSGLERKINVPAG